MYGFPIKHFEENLIFNQMKSECWASYKMKGFNYDYRHDDSKIQILNTLARFIANIGIEAKILIVPISQDIDSHYDDIIQSLDKSDPLYNKARIHAIGSRDHIKDRIKRKGSTNDYNVYVQTKLELKETVIKSIKDAIAYFFQHPVNSIEEGLGTETRVILEREIKAFQDMAVEYFKKQSKRISLEKCSEDTTQWLAKRSFRRGLGEVKIRGNWYKSAAGRRWLKKNREKLQMEEDAIEEMIKRPWTPFSERTLRNGEALKITDTRGILTLAEGKIDVKEETTLKIHHDDGISHQSFLSVSHIPDGMMFPGCEWLMVLQDFPFQTEVCIHIDTVEHQESISTIGKRKRDIKGQIEHVKDSREEVSDELWDAQENADALEAELKKTRAPITKASISICVAADNKEDLEDRVNFIKEYYEDHDFIIERSRADQLKLFMEFLPGTGRYVTDYIHPLPPRTLAGSMFAATRMLGDNIGPYIGTTGIVEKNVYLDMGRACLLNRSASAAFLGTLGGGKSFNANLLTYLNVMYGGGKALIFDPKGERTKWLHLLPELEGYINVINLSPEEKDKGKLDPFIIYRDDFDEASDMAVNILAEIFKLDPNDDKYTAVLEAIELMKEDNSPKCMINLSNKLMEFPKEDELAKPARMLGRKIKLLRKTGMAGLLFGDGTEKALDFKNRINIIQIQNLAMPKAETPKKDYSREENLATVLMIPIASFAKRFAMSGEPIFKLVLFDESWGLKATTMGLKLMDFLARMGRSLYAGCIFIGHSVKDVDDAGIKNAISYKFCFKSSDTEEVKRMLAFLDLEITEENIEEVKSLRNGECLFQDLDGRVGKLKFDAVYSHLIKAFETTPKKEGGENEKTA